MNHSVLFPPRETRQHWNDQLTTWLADADERVGRGSVTPTLDLASFQSELAAIDFENPMPFGDLLEWTIAGMETGVVHMNHPRYFGLFNPAPTFPAQCAARIAASFNPQLATAPTSPFPVALEAHGAMGVVAQAPSVAPFQVVADEVEVASVYESPPASGASVKEPAAPANA